MTVPIIVQLPVEIEKQVRQIAAELAGGSVSAYVLRLHTDFMETRQKPDSRMEAVQLLSVRMADRPLDSKAYNTQMDDLIRSHRNFLRLLDGISPRQASARIIARVRYYYDLLQAHIKKTEGSGLDPYSETELGSLLMDWIKELQETLENMETKGSCGLPCLKCGSLNTKLHGSGVKCKECGTVPRKASYVCQLIRKAMTDYVTFEKIDWKKIIQIVRTAHRTPTAEGTTEEDTNTDKQEPEEDSKPESGMRFVVNGTTFVPKGEPAREEPQGPPRRDGTDR